ncbi:MAG: hypothetical protein WC707_06980 [Candidatus Babeliaceae bacterium]
MKNCLLKKKQIITNYSSATVYSFTASNEYWWLVSDKLAIGTIIVSDTEAYQITEALEIGTEINFLKAFSGNIRIFVPATPVKQSIEFIQVIPDSHIPQKTEEKQTLIELLTEKFNLLIETIKN